MTELETMQRAKMYMDKLAQGIDPISGQELPEDSALNNVRLARCFFYVSGVLEKVIANDGYIGAKPKVKQLPFEITEAELARVPVSQEPLRITELVTQISNTVGNPQMKKLPTTTITNWLLEKGFLMKQIGLDGKEQRVPTEHGCRLGLSARSRQGMYGEYLAVYYDANAQRFVLDNLLSILQEKQ